MSYSRDIFAAYTAPRKVMHRQLGQGIGENRALAYLIIGSFLMFISQMPEVSRRAHLEGIDLVNQAFNQFIGAVFLFPLLMYGVAAIVHLIARAFGGKGNWLDARIATFWAILAICPVMLFRGLVDGFIGAGPVLTIVNVASAAVFFHIWIGSMIAAENPEDADV